MSRLLTLAPGAVLIPKLWAEPELKGSASELADHLASTVTGESEVRVTSDRAVIGLKATTENESLQDALSFSCLLPAFRPTA